MFLFVTCILKSLSSFLHSLTTPRHRNWPPIPCDTPEWRALLNPLYHAATNIYSLKPHGSENCLQTSGLCCFWLALVRFTRNLHSFSPRNQTIEKLDHGGAGQKVVKKSRNCDALRSSPGSRNVFCLLEQIAQLSQWARDRFAMLEME